MRLAARFMSALLIATLVLPSLIAAPVAASGLTDHFTITGLPATVTAGVPETITVTAETIGNTTDGTFAGTINWTSNDALATLPVDGQSLTLGSATFSVTFRTAGSKSVTVTETGDPTTTGTAGTTVVAAAADRFAVAGFADPTVAGAAHNVTVTAEDQWGNKDTSYAGTVRFTSNDPQAVLPADSTLTLGTDTFSATLKTVGTRTIDVVDTVNGAMTGGQGGISVTPATAASLVLGVYPDPTVSGALHPVSVTAKDAFGNTATGYGGTVTVTSTDPADLISAPNTLTAGVGSFNVTLNTVGDWTITASDGTFSDSQPLVTVVPGTANHFVVGGFTSPATAGVADTFTVTAKDAANNTVTNFTGTVTFSSSDLQAVLPAPYTFVLGDAGVQSFSGTLKTAGSQSITATDGGATGSQTSITVNATVATHFVVSGFTDPTVAGVSHNVTVTAKDSFNNTATGYGGTVAITSSDGAATLPADNTLTAGVGTFAVTLRTVGPQSITATDTLTPSINGTQGGITVDPAAATHFSVAGFTSPTIAGAAHSVTVTALDQFNNTATGYTGTVHLTSSDAQAALTANHTFGSGELGIHTFNGSSLGTVGTQSITATDTLTPSINGTQTGIVVDPAAATHLAVAGFADPTVAGVPDTFTVTALDAFDNTATGYTGTVHLTSSDSGAVLDGNHIYTLGEAGVHTFTGNLRTAGDQTITATDTVTGAITGAQTNITVTPDVATHFTVAGFSDPTVAGVPHNVTVTARDQFNNTATGYAGTVAITSSDGAAALPANAGLGSGVGSFSVTLKTVGTQSITATDTLDGSITGAQSGITVDPAAATHFSVAGYPDPTVAGVSHTFVVTALDAFNNTATGYTGIVHLTSSDGAVVLDANHTYTLGEAGVHTFNGTLKTAGDQSITATDTVSASITGTQSLITVTPAAATHFSVAGYPDPTVAGVSHTFVVTALDAFNNTATGYTGIVHLTSSDGAAVLDPNHTYTLGEAGVHTFNGTLETVGIQSITATDTVSASITGSQGSINVNAAAATHFSVAGYPDPTVAGVSHTFVVTALDAFNNTATGYTGIVHLTSSDGAAVLDSNHTYTGGEAGVHTFNGTLKTAGIQSITATDTVTASITGSQPGINVNPAAAATLMVAGFGSPATAGVSDFVTITALDAFGNTATGYTGTVHLTSTDLAGSMPGNYAFTLVNNGVHTLSATLRTVGTHSITATDTVTASITGVQTGIVVDPAPASHFTVTGFTNPVTAGVAGSITVTALDPFDNIDTNYTGIVHFTSNDAQASLPANYPFVSGDNGVHAFGATLKTVGTRTITATDTVTASITGAQTGIVVNPAAADHFSVTAFTTPTVAGVAHNLTVTARDAFNNVATGYTGTAHLTSSDPQAVMAADHIFVSGDAGAHTFSGSNLRTVGTWSITATDTVTASITGLQSGIVVNPAAAATLVVGGYSSPAVVGFSDSFSVTARDAFNNVATGYLGTVHFTSSDLAAVLPGNYPFVALDAGTHNFSATFHTAGTQSITGTDTVIGSITGTQSGIVVDPAPATHFGVAGFADPITAGLGDTFTVTALDQFNNTDTNYVGSVHFTSTDVQAILPSNYTFVSGDNGAHQFGATLKTAGDQSITATDMVTASITGAQSAITVTPAAATHLAVTGFQTPITAGVTDSFVVTALDAFGNVATGYGGTVHLSSSDIQAVLTPDHVFNGVDAGVHSFAGSNLRTAGTQSITATDTVTASITGIQSGIVVNPGAATHFNVAGFSNPTTAGVSHNVTVTARDAFNNTATGYLGSVAITSSDGGAVLPANNTLTSGVGTFAVTLTTAAVQSITATDTVTASITGSQVGITVDPAAATHFGVSGFTTPTVAGISHSVTVTALDAFENVATGYAGTVHFTSSDIQAVLPSNSTLTSGTGSFSATLRTAGTQSITATDTVTASITGTQSGIVVTHAAANHLTVTGFLSPITAGVADSVTVTALDAFNNLVDDYTGTVHFASSDGQAVLPPNYTFTLVDLGDHNFPATLKTAGTRSISATDTVLPAITGSQTGIVVNSAAAVTLTVTGFANPTIAGQAHSLTVTAFDAFDNVANGYTGTVHFTSTDGGAVTLPSDYTFVGGDSGTRVFGGVTLVTAGTQSIIGVDDVSSSITGTQSGIVVNPAAASHFLVAGFTAPTVSGASHNVTVTALDDFANVATGYLGIVAITSSDPAAALPANHTYTALEAGVHVFAVTLNTAGVRSITATDTVTSSITGTQTGIGVDVGAPDHIVISPDTSSVLAGVDVTYTAEGFDLANNSIGDFTANTSFGISGGGTCSATDCHAATVGAHTVTGTDVVDGGLADTATLTIVNEDPAPVDDFPAAILEDATATTFDVLANDTDVNLDSLTIVAKTDGAKGTVAINGSGLDLAYTPNANANGSDTFTYTLDDGNGGSATATVHVTITPVNDAPTFSVQASTTIAEQSGVAPQSVPFFATAMSSGPADESAQNLNFTISNNRPTLFAVQPSVNVSTGTLTYTPAVNRNGTATVTLTLHDDGGLLNGGTDQTTHTFQIIVTGPNHAPFAINDAYTVVSGSPATAVPVLVNDNAANPDVGEVLKIVNVTQGAHGTVAITGAGTGLTYRPKSGFIGVDFFTYRVKDATLFSGYATVRVQVPKDLYKPVSTAPIQTISNQIIGSSTVIVRLTWTGTDRGYGIKNFELWASTNGHSYTKIKTTTGHAASVTLSVGSSYRFRVRAIDNKGNVGSFAYGPTFLVNRYQESSATYSSPWSYLTGSAYSGGHARTTTTAGLSASLTSIGRTFAWVSDAGPTRGTADIYIDNVLVKSMSLTSSATTYRYLVYSITLATSATHTIKVVYTGPGTKRIDVDAFIVLR